MRIILGLIAAASLAAPPPPEPLAPEIAALRTFAASHGEALWRGYGAAPFGVLLIRGGREILLCQPGPPPGFTPEGRDAATGCDRFSRPRSRFGDGLLAAMPVFGPPSTIVMGPPEAAGLALPRWRATVLHEHFHQWQAALPDYYARVAALDLAGGDASGMWMLNFAFPYAEPRVAAAHAEAARALAEAVRARGQRTFHWRFSEYLAARRAFAAAAGPRNWRYFEFQLWQEGIARWTELALSRASPDPAMRADGEAREAAILAALGRPDLATEQRLAVYTMGAGEGLLLDVCRAPWRTNYRNVLALGPLLDDAARHCR
jgi:hypothetical protein